MIVVLEAEDVDHLSDEMIRFASEVYIRCALEAEVDFQANLMLAMGRALQDALRVRADEFAAVVEGLVLKPGDDSP